MAELTSEADEPNRSHRAPLLLHSLAELREVIMPCLDIADARTVVEVGAEEGAFTRVLLSWADKRGAKVYSIEPHPSPSLRDICEASPSGQLVEGRSPQALTELEAADAYLIDGDHNYHTVLGELTAIARHTGGRGDAPLVLLNDVGWPCGRRDMYYSPGSLPPEAVHPYTYEKGLTLGSKGVVDGGFRGEGQHAFATEEGGPSNGVLTAVEDFMSTREDLAFVNVPCVFGLGIVYARSSSYAEPLAEFLSFYDDHPLLGRLERNRLALYLAVLELQDDLDELRGDLGECQLSLQDVTTENRALWARTHQLEAALASLKDAVAPLLASRPFALAERLSSVRELRGEAPTVSRQRLRAALESASES